MTHFYNNQYILHKIFQFVNNYAEITEVNDDG